MLRLGHAERKEPDPVKSCVFTVEERGLVRDRILEMARADTRVVAAAIIGSLAGGGGDRWSDVDLTFGLAEGTEAVDILDEWTRTLRREFDAAHLFDLPFRSTLYRVFLFPGNLQVDLSFTPAREFGALGPKFELLYGQAVERAAIPRSSAHELFGLAAHHVVRARFCLERGRLWQAEYWISGARDQALCLACLERGVETRYARGYDDLPDERRRSFEDGLVRSLDRDELFRALGCVIEALMRETGEARDLAARLEGQLRELASREWGSASVS